MQPLSKAVIEEVIVNHPFTLTLQSKYSEDWASAIETKLIASPAFRLFAVPEKTQDEQEHIDEMN